MEVKANWTTCNHTDEGCLHVAHTYWNSYDGELFTVLEENNDLVRILIHNTDVTEWVDSETLAVDYDMVHPVEMSLQ